MISVSVPGKIHISGEHSVVYGEPALLATVDKRVTVLGEKTNNKKIQITYKTSEQKNPDRCNIVPITIEKTYQHLKKQTAENIALEIRSDIPIGVGMGSSAALAAAVAGTVLRLENHPCERDIINSIAYEVEKTAHDNPSGGDNMAVIYGGLVVYQKKKDKKQFKTLNIQHAPTFLCINSGMPSETTGQMIAHINHADKKIKSIFSAIGEITTKIIDMFEQNNYEHLGALISKNQKYLEKIGVVGRKAKDVIQVIEAHNGSAKISGAGGIQKGSGIILAYHENIDTLEQIVKQHNYTYFKATLSQRGITCETV